jgi:hypothetical protein
MSPRLKRIRAGRVQPKDVIRRPEEIAKEVLPTGVQNFMGLCDQEGDTTFGEIGQVRQRPVEEPRRLVLRYIVIHMFEKSLQYFIDHQDELVRQYEGKVLVLVEDYVVGVYENALEAYLQAGPTRRLQG